MKKRTIKIGILFLVATAAIMAAAMGCGGLASGEVARVYGQPISEEQWQQRIELLAMSTGTPPETMSKEARDRVSRQAAKQLVTEKVIQHQGEERGLVADDEAVQVQLDKMIELRYAGDRDAMLADLQARKTTEADFSEGLRLQLTQKKLYDDIAAGVEVSDDDAYESFLKFTENYMSPEYRKFRMLAVADAATAQDLKRRIDAGEGFSSLVIAYTIDEKSKASQGEESLQRGQASDRIPAQVIDAVFGLTVNEVTGPLDAGQGFYIVKLEYIEPDKETPFEHVREQFRQQARAQRVDFAWQEFLAQADKDADAVYREDADPGMTSQQ